MHDVPWEHFHNPVGGDDDVVVWKTVGLDIGSSTSQILFSQVTLTRNDAVYVVTDRRVLHESEVILTPYAAPETIDGERLADFFDREFDAAGLTRLQINAGAVILTGLALSTQNSRAIADAVADDSGRFVAVSAGDHLEARLAANGAGVPWISHKRDGLIVHIDVGGGTTKLSAWHRGHLKALAAVDIGARLITLDDAKRVKRIEPPAAGVISDLHLDIHENEILEPAKETRIAGAMARNVLRYAGVLREPPRGASLLRTEPLFASSEHQPVEAVILSGGVSEYVYGREARTFGDLGLALGGALRDEIEKSGVELIPFDRGIRATVLGVSQFSTQLSGNTIFVSDQSLLPLRNVPVVIPHLHLDAERLDSVKIESAIASALAKRFEAGQKGLMSLAIRWQGSATYDRLTALAEAICAAVLPQLRTRDPVIVICDGDVAGVLGARITDIVDPERSVLCLDSVHVHEFDHVDIGQFANRTQALPVIVKSLLFASSGQGKTHARH
jgi:ethanolamine utilization protein EutA (predicted chaperonin)